MKVQARSEPPRASAAPPTAPPPPRAHLKLRRKLPDEERPEALPMGGPLALHLAPPSKAQAPPPAIAPVDPAALCDRIVVGRTRDGLPEVRLDVSVGALRGTEVVVTAAPRGVEATFVVATEAARRVIEARLADLARALEGKGLHVARCRVATNPTKMRP